MPIGSKGISPIIATILVLLVTVAVVAFVFIFLKNTTNTATTATETQINTLNSNVAPLSIDSASGREIYIRNLGAKPVKNTTVALYIDGVAPNMSMPDIFNNTGVAAINLTDGILPAGTYNFRLTSGYFDYKTVVNVPMVNTLLDPDFGTRPPIYTMLVMDKSASMVIPTQNDQSIRLIDAMVAALAFVDSTAPQDNIGTVWFHVNATDQQAFTTNKDIVKRHGILHDCTDPPYITQLQQVNCIIAIMNNWTFIEGGIRNATKQFIPIASPNKIEILLTDGDQTHGNALAAAVNASLYGIKIYTIGIGDTPNQQLLKDIANVTGGSFYYSAEAGPQLLNIMRDISAKIGNKWLKVGNATIDSYFSYCYSPETCLKFVNSTNISYVYQDVKPIFPGTYNVNANAYVNTSGAVCSNQCPSLPGETCRAGDARLKLIAFDEYGGVMGSTYSPWASTLGTGWQKLSMSWTTPPAIRGLRMQVEPGNCCSASCVANNVFVDDAYMTISKP